MPVQLDATAVSPVTSTTSESEVSSMYQEGIVAGLIGAATIAIWFLIVDTMSGRPLFTPTVLGTALFHRGAALTTPEALPISLEMVSMFTWVHGLVFAAIGGIAAKLLSLAERHPGVGFGVLLFFVLFEFGFIVVAMLFASSVLNALTLPSVLVANLLAAAAMGAYFRLRHPTLVVEP